MIQVLNEVFGGWFPSSAQSGLEMPQFYPLYLRRSDGVLNLRDGRNEPTLEQLDQKPNAQGISDFYRHSPPGDAKEMDWRRKLGGMLIREVGGKESNNGSALAMIFVERNTPFAQLLTLLRKELHPCCPSGKLPRLRAPKSPAL